MASRDPDETARPRAALPQPVRFLLAGGLAALANFASRIVFSVWLPFPVAVTLAYGIGMATAFVLNRRYVFTQASTRLHQQIVWFVAVNAAALLQTLAASLILARAVFPALGVPHAELLAHAIAIGVPIVTSYIGHKRLTFRRDDGSRSSRD